MSHITLPPDDLRGKVRATLAAHLGDEIAGLPDDTLLPDAFSDRYDSLGALECISLIELAFDIEVDFVAHDVRYWFATPARIVQFVTDQVEDQKITRGVL
jgi:acyl carrier protein